MLTRDQIYPLFTLFYKQEQNAEASAPPLPKEMIRHIAEMSDATPDTAYLRLAFKLARSGTTESLSELAKMIEDKPEILLQKGYVTTRGGVRVSGVTLYEFFLGEGDPVAAKQIEFGFTKIAEGENERVRQYEQYKPQLEKLAKQIEEKKPVYDLRPLFDIVIKSSLADIAEALSANDPNREVTRNTPLRAALAAFRRAVQPKRKTAGQMHYEHYTTLQQAFDLLFDQNMRDKLTDNYTNYDKVRLIWRQIVGYLELKGLPSVDRFALAGALEDEDRTTQYIDDNDHEFPDAGEEDGDSSLTGAGFDVAIFGQCLQLPAGVSTPWATCWKTHLEQKCQTFRAYAATTTVETSDRVLGYEQSVSAHTIDDQMTAPTIG